MLERGHVLDLYRLIQPTIFNLWSIAPNSQQLFYLLYLINFRLVLMLFFISFRCQEHADVTVPARGREPVLVQM